MVYLKTKNILLVGVFLMPLLTRAQTNESLIRVHLTGGYADQLTLSITDPDNAVSSKTSSWNVGGAVGFKLSEHWELGVGLSYQEQVTKTPETFINFGGMQIPMAATKSTTSFLIGDVYVTYYLNLFNKLYFTPSCTLGYGQITVEQSVGATEKQDFSYSAIQLSPGLTYFFNKKFACTLNLGGVQMSLVDWEWKNRQILANFTPAYWQWGVVVAF